MRIVKIEAVYNLSHNFYILRMLLSRVQWFPFSQYIPKLQRNKIMYMIVLRLNAN